MLRPLRANATDLEESDSFSCHTLLTTDDSASRLFVVSRFWTENCERRRHAFWVAGATVLHQTGLQSTCVPETANERNSDDFRESSRDQVRELCAPVSRASLRTLFIDVREISQISFHPGARGYSKFTPTSSIGKLRTGEHYFIYRFLFFWDGFEVQTGKPASGDGIYLLPLNLPPSCRRNPSAVRVLSLTPPGVKGEEILDRILEDILHGSTTGFADYDAEGTKRRIFLDLVGLIGDTPALNHYLDVVGHNALACCHLCSYIRGPERLLGIGTVTSARTE